MQLVNKLRLSPIFVTLDMSTVIIILQNIIYLCADKISTASLYCNDNISSYLYYVSGDV